MVPPLPTWSICVLVVHTRANGGQGGWLVSQGEQQQECREGGWQNSRNDNIMNTDRWLAEWKSDSWDVVVVVEWWIYGDTVSSSRVIVTTSQHYIGEEPQRVETSSCLTDEFDDGTLLLFLLLLLLLLLLLCGCFNKLKKYSYCYETTWRWRGWEGRGSGVFVFELN